MTFPLFSRVILAQDLPDENLITGDMGTVVEYHTATERHPEGYEVEFFASIGETHAVVSIPASILRAATRQDLLHVREVEQEG